jgi:hypothetical protein
VNVLPAGYAAAADGTGLGLEVTMSCRSVVPGGTRHPPADRPKNTPFAGPIAPLSARLGTHEFANRETVDAVTAREPLCRRAAGIETIFESDFK